LLLLLRKNTQRVGSAVYLGVGAAVASGLRDDADGMCLLRPFLGTQTETVQTGLTFNYVEFGTIKIGIHQLLPDAQELDGVAVAQPVGKEELALLGLQHVGQADVVIVIHLDDIYLLVLYDYLSHSLCCF